MCLGRFVSRAEPTERPEYINRTDSRPMRFNAIITRTLINARTLPAIEVDPSPVPRPSHVLFNFPTQP